MDKDLKAKWVAALRSGEYIQGTTFLYLEPHSSRNDKETFCCLGVLCDIKFPKTFKTDENPNDQKYYNAVRLDIEGTYVWNGHADTLMRMNDDFYKTFAEIADYIEEKL